MPPKKVYKCGAAKRKLQEKREEEKRQLSSRLREFVTSSSVEPASTASTSAELPGN